MTYATGLKTATHFRAEPRADGSDLIVTDVYGGSLEERQARAAEVDLSLNAWGRALRDILEARPERVALLASGGMSHYPGTDRYASPDFEWDRAMLRTLEEGRGAETARLTGDELDKAGKTAGLEVRKDLNITKAEQLKGKKIANQTGSSIGNIFVDQVLPDNGLKKGEFQEVRMNVNDMIAAMAAKTVDAMVNIEPYNAIVEADGIGTVIINLEKYDNVPVFMAATPDFVEKHPDAVVNYLKAWLEVAKDFKDNPKKVSDVIYAFFTSKGYKMSAETFAKAMGRDFDRDFARE